MKYLLCIPHSIYFSWICWFGGKIEGKELFLLWTAKLGNDADVSLKDLTIHFMREDMALFKSLRVKGCKPIEPGMEVPPWVFGDSDEEGE